MYDEFDSKFNELIEAHKTEFKNALNNKKKLLRYKKFQDIKLLVSILLVLFCFGFSIAGLFFPELKMIPKIFSILSIVLLIFLISRIKGICKSQTEAIQKANMSESEYHQLIGDKLKLPLLGEKFNINNCIFSQSLSRDDYAIASVNSDYDIYKSNEYWELFVLKKETQEYILKLNNVFTYSEEHDMENNTYYTVPLFKGTVGIIDLPFDIKTNISICSSNRECNKIDMDMAKFNELFSVTTADEIMARSLLTADVMEYLIDLRENVYGEMFDIVIDNNKLYMRFYDKPIFNTEKDMFNKNVYKETISNFSDIEYLSKKILNMILESSIGR